MRKTNINHQHLTIANSGTRILYIIINCDILADFQNRHIFSDVDHNNILICISTADLSQLNVYFF